MAHHRSLLACAALAVAAAAGCASSSMSDYSRPYAIFEAEHRLGTQGIVPAIPWQIDGREVAGRKDPVPPGRHEVMVNISGTGEAGRKTMTIDAQPCTRYYLGAKNEPGKGLVPMVVSSENIGECNK